MRVAVVGLGAMGGGMARALLSAGHEVLGLDVDRARVAAFEDAGGLSGGLAGQVGALDGVVCVVLNATQTEAALWGDDGVARALAQGGVIVSCATVPPAFARAMADRAGAAGLLYLDAPISGGAAKAASGDLSIMASGAPGAFAAARPLLDAMAATVFELGDAAGAGSAMKAVNQLLAGVHIAAMAEAMAFGVSQGIDPARFMEVIPRCAGTSWMLEDRGARLAAGDAAPRSAVDIWPKDLGIVADIAREARVPVPLAAAALQRFVAASGMGLGQADDSTVARVYARDAGLSLPGDDA